MDYLLPAILAGIAGGAIGSAISLVFQSRRRCTYASGILVGAGLIATLFPGVRFAEAGYAVAAALVVLLVCSMVSRHSLRRSMQFAPLLRDYGLKHFKRLDLGGDGYLTREDLEVALLDAELSAEDRKLIKRLAWDLCVAGQVVDTTVSVSPASGTVVHYEHYGVSREDLQTYPQRIAERYAREYGD